MPKADPPPFVITGATGMLGRAWRELLAQQRRRHAAHGRDTLDITDPLSVRDAIPKGTRVVVNTAAYTRVDDCETHEPEAMRVNRDGVMHLAERCRDIDATLVHYSTDYVFAGDADRPYRPGDPIDPVNAYGRTKAAGERALRGVGCDYRLIRTSWLYAPWSTNFVRTIARLAAERQALQVVDDQRGRPTSAAALARASARLIVRGGRGVYHVADGGECTWHGFAAEIVRLTGARCALTPCDSAAFPRPAKRPAYSVLDLSATESLLGPTPPWPQRLRRAIARMEPVTPAAQAPAEARAS